MNADRRFMNSNAFEVIIFTVIIIIPIMQIIFKSQYTAIMTGCKFRSFNLISFRAQFCIIIHKVNNIG